MITVSKVFTIESEDFIKGDKLSHERFAVSSKKDTGINIENLWFYFDSIERDCMDLGMLDRKSTQVQALKGKLMRLPQAQFDAAIKTIERLVDDSTPTTQKRDIEAAKKKASMALYERTASVGDKKDQTSTLN